MGWAKVLEKNAVLINVQGNKRKAADKMSDFSYTVQNGDKGLTYIFLKKAEEAGYEGDSSKINWQNVMSVFDEVQAEEKAEGEQLYSGGNDKTRAGWGKSYLIKAGDVINLTKAQLDKIYAAMGFKKAATTPPATTPPATTPPATTPPATTPPAVTPPPASQNIPQAMSSEELEKYKVQVIDPKNAGKTVPQSDGTKIVYDKEGRIDKILNKDGKEIRDVDYKEDGSIFAVYTFEYDGNNCTRKVCYNADGSVHWFSDYEYDGNKKTRMVDYKADGSVAWFSDYEYDGNKKTRSVYYNSDGSVWYYTEYEYNSDNIIIDIKRYNPDGTPYE